MEFEEAKKKVRADKPKENFMLIPFGYDRNYVVPYKDGISIMTALANAERLITNYGEKTRITGLERNEFSPQILSHHEYELIKIANLLQVDYKDLKDSTNI